MDSSDYAVGVLLLKSRRPNTAGALSPHRGIIRSAKDRRLVCDFESSFGFGRPQFSPKAHRGISFSLLLIGLPSVVECIESKIDRTDGDHAFHQGLELATKGLTELTDGTPLSGNTSAGAPRYNRPDPKDSSRPC